MTGELSKAHWDTSEDFREFINAGWSTKAQLRLRERDGDDCHWCGEFVLNGTVDHIVPVSWSGPYSDDNLVLAHAWCNWKRGNSLSPHSGCDFCEAAKAKYPAIPRKKRT